MSSSEYAIRKHPLFGPLFGLYSGSPGRRDLQISGIRCDSYTNLGTTYELPYGVYHKYNFCLSIIEVFYECSIQVPVFVTVTNKNQFGLSIIEVSVTNVNLKYLLSLLQLPISITFAFL